ncbi:uncharacterized protein LOC112688927 isoform X2 [Sipha flava]|nr:uncharacterized protein LOC112688927 isoform X2 [Sipha flava]
MNKNEFFHLLNLRAVKPNQDVERRLLIPPMSCTALKEKNNSTVTGYENYYLTEGNTKLYPVKDFDFIGKHVICQKCYQRFASKFSFKAHIGTDVCVKSYNGPNLVYVKFKNKFGRQGRKKYTTEPLKDFHHDIKKNLLNPEMLNTLQTRKNCYSDVIHQRNKVKEKSVTNNEPRVKKPRGRPRKNVEAEPNKQNQPKQLNSTTVNTNSSEEFEFKKPLPVSGRVVDAYNNNVENEKQEFLSPNINSIAGKFWNIFNEVWKKNEMELKQEYSEHYLKKEEGKFDTSVVEDLHLNLEGLKNELLNLLKQLEDFHVSYNYKNDIELMLSKLDEKLNELKPTELKKTYMHSDPTTGKGKENIHRSIKKNEKDFGSDEKCSGKKLNGNINDNMMDVEDSKTQDIIKKKLETEAAIKNYTNSVPSHLNNVSLNNIYNPIMECKICVKRFGSLIEWKMHCAEHVGISDKKCMCKICGFKFRMYRDCLKHMNTHCITRAKNNEKRFKCKKCNKQYNFLALYYGHIRTHV